MAPLTAQKPSPPVVICLFFSVKLQHPQKKVGKLASRVLLHQLLDSGGSARLQRAERAAAHSPCRSNPIASALRHSRLQRHCAMQGSCSYRGAALASPRSAEARPAALRNGALTRARPCAGSRWLRCTAALSGGDRAPARGASDGKAPSGVSLDVQESLASIVPFRKASGGTQGPLSQQQQRGEPGSTAGGPVGRDRAAPTWPTEAARAGLYSDVPTERVGAGAACEPP